MASRGLQDLLFPSGDMPLLLVPGAAPFGYVGPVGGGSFYTRQQEADLAQQAREAAAARMAGGIRRPAPWPGNPSSAPLQGQDMLAPSPQLPWYGYQGLPQNAAPTEPVIPSLDVPLPRPRPDMVTGDTENEAVLPSAATPTQGYAPAQQTPGNPLGSFLSNNAGMLVGLGAGIAGGRDWGSGIASGLLLGDRMGSAERSRQQSAMAQREIYSAVLSATGDPRKATLAAINPDASKQIMEQLFGTRKPAGTFKIGGAEIPYTIGADGTAQLIMPGGADGPQDIPQFINQLQALDAQAKQRNAAAEARGKVQGEAAATLPGTLAKADEALALIEKIRNHPGRSAGTGAVGGNIRVPGTPQADFVDLVDQAAGEAFLQAYQNLKGGGAISEAEGKKAEQAIARLKRDKTPEGFEDALNDFAAVIRRGRENAGVAAGGKPTPAAPAQSGWTTVAPGVRIRERAQ